MSTDSCRRATRSPEVVWNEAVYKVGDPIVSNESDRFRGVIFNNMKGKIVKIERVPGRITFDVDTISRLLPKIFNGLICAWLLAPSCNSMFSSEGTQTRTTTQRTRSSPSRSPMLSRFTKRRVSNTPR